MKLKCPACDFSASNANGLSIHARKKHSMGGRRLYDALFPGARQLCACGCGQETSFKSMCEGYATYLRGHHRRKYRMPAAATAAPPCACGCGDRVVWNKQRGKFNEYLHGHNSRGKVSPFKGLTKETCGKFRRQSQTIMANVEERRRRAQQWRDLHRSGRIPVGPAHHNWKGGIAKFGDRLSGHPRLYADWKLPHLKAAKFQCQLCGRSNELNVHHDDLSMMRIVAEHVDDASVLSDSEKTERVNDVVDYHVEQKVSATILCGGCHRTLHSRKGNVAARDTFNEVVEFIVGLGFTNVNTYVGGSTFEVEVPERSIVFACSDLFRSCAAVAGEPYDAKLQSIHYTERGVGYFHIFEDEWRDSRSIVVSMIRARLGVTARTFDARKCDLVRLQSTTDDRRKRSRFFDLTHIDGDVRAFAAYSLTFNDEPVAMLSLGRRRGTVWSKRGLIEVKRFSTALDSRVRGGLGRLIAAARRDLGEGCGLGTYVDMRHGTGASYEAVGFEREGQTSAPRFWWTDFARRYDRMQFKADRMRWMTERQVADEAGVYKIYGCPNIRMVLR